MKSDDIYLTALKNNVLRRYRNQHEFRIILHMSSQLEMYSNLHPIVH
jgi:hypothetical protein